ncbi:MAG TPA: ABC transporter permease [Gemmatimonadales bacterium]
MLRDLLHDLRHGARVFARRPAFTLTAIVTIALAIAANAVVFGVVSAVLLRPLPYPDAERLVSLRPDEFMSYREVAFVGEQATGFAAVGGIVGSWDMTLTGLDRPTKLEAARVTANLFSILGVPAARGRTFVEAEGIPGGDNVVVMSHALWTGRFGSDSGAVGSHLTLDGVRHTVVGVMPPGFELGHPQTEIWRVLPLDRDAWYYEGGGLLGVARLRPGVSLQAARAEFVGLSRRLKETYGYAEDYLAGASVIGLQERIVGSLRPILLVALGAVGFVLLLAGANLANLLLARAAGRQREMAVRVALGASRARLMRQLLTEATLLAVLGGIGGIALAYWGLGVIVHALPADTPRLCAVSLHLGILAVSAALTLGTGLVFGLAPAVLVTRARTQSMLRGGRGFDTGGSGRRTRMALVTAEVALGMTLLVSAALMVQTLWRLSRVDPGFDSHHVLTMQLQPTGGQIQTQTQLVAYYRALFERLEAVPQVVAVGAIQHMPLSGGSWASDIEVEGRPVGAGERPPRVGWRVIGGDYFRALAISLRAGRLFGDDDRLGALPVVVINEAMARRHWPGESALGNRVRARNATGGEWATVIGVVGDIRHGTLDAPPVPEMFRPLTQYPHGGMTLALRTVGDPRALIPSITDAVWSVGRDVPIAAVQTLDEIVAQSIAQPRLVMFLLGAFAVLGLVLGAIGTYGVVAYQVTARTREFGIRIALGAHPPTVVRSVMREGTRLAVVGIVVGALVALVVGRYLAGLVFEVAPSDPLTFAVVGVILIGLTALASWLPARRVAGIDPVVALREE